MLFFIQFTSLLFLMLVTGIFWGPWFSLHRSMKVFSKEEFIKIVKTMSANLAVPMRFLLPACVLLMIIAAFLYPLKVSIGFYCAIISIILILVSLIVTVLVEVPIVKQIGQWSPETVPLNMEAIQDKWLRFHVIRTFSAILSFASFCVSVLYL